MAAEVEGGSPVSYEEHFFSAADGLRLFYRRWFKDGARGLVALVHGFAEHSGRYDHVAAALNEAGYSAAAFDYRGHGQSGGRRAHIDSFDQYLGDVRSFLAEIAQDGYPQPPVLLGHSQGGLIAARLAELDGERIRGLALSSPFFGLAMEVPALKVAAGRLVSKILPTLAMKSGVDPAWLSHDRQVVDRYAADPLVSDVATTRWFTEVMQAQQASMASAAGLKVPLLMLLAGDDKLASVQESRRFFESAGSSDKRLEIYEDFYHEIFNELGRDRPLSDLVDWLGRET
ncbi:MAG: lysophospholipase [Deltaproteobacteria bacterium]|nr:lysophospholipase [Deltaproteobacteria bacterium]